MFSGVWQHLQTWKKPSIRILPPKKKYLSEMPFTNRPVMIFFAGKLCSFPKIGQFFSFFSSFQYRRKHP